MDELIDLTSLIESNSSRSNDFISDSDQDENFNDEITTDDIVEIVEDNQESISEDIEEEKIIESEEEITTSEENEDEPVIDDTIDDDSSSLGLKSQNNSIKLDLFLNQCANKNFSYGFLRYKNVSVDFSTDKDTLIEKIISNFDLKSIMDFKYKYNTSNIESIFNSFIKPLKVVDLVEIAEKYDVKVSLSKENLKNNFMEKFSPYDLILIMSNEGLNIWEHSPISVLEQIYLLSDSILEKNIDKCPNIEKSRYEMIYCIVNHYSEGFLISTNQLDLGDDAK